MTCVWVRRRLCRWNCCEPHWADSALASLTAASDNTCLPLMVSPRPRPSIATRVVSRVCATGGVGVQRVKGVFLRVAVGRRTRNVGGRNRNCGCTNGSPVGRRRVCRLLSCCGLWATLFRACARCGVCVGSRPVAHSDGHHFVRCSWSGALRCVPYCGALETSVLSLVLHWKKVFFVASRRSLCFCCPPSPSFVVTWADSAWGGQPSSVGQKPVFHFSCHLVHVLPLPHESFHAFVPRVVSVCSGLKASFNGWRWVVGLDTLVGKIQRTSDLPSSCARV